MAEEIGSKTIVVTGGAGFAGSNLCIFLKSKYPKYSVLALDNLRRRGSELNVERLRQLDITFLHADIRNAEDLILPEKVDVIIDASADPSVLAGINTPALPLLHTNLTGTINCIELAMQKKAQFIFLSTSRVYPIQALNQGEFEELPTRFQWSNKQNQPGISGAGITEDFSLEGTRSFYGAAKLCCELLINEYHALKGLPAVINRCGVLSGPWQMGKADQGIISFWIASHYFKKNLKYIGYGGGGKQLRDVLHIDDLASLIDHQIHFPSLYNGRTINVGGGLDSSFSLQELTGISREITGHAVNIQSDPIDREADIRIYVSNCAKLFSYSDWRPTKSLEEITNDVFLWIKGNEKDLKKVMA